MTKFSESGSFVGTKTPSAAYDQLWRSIGLITVFIVVAVVFAIKAYLFSPEHWKWGMTVWLVGNIGVIWLLVVLLRLCMQEVTQAPSKKRRRKSEVLGKMLALLAGAVIVLVGFLVVRQSTTIVHAFSSAPQVYEGRCSVSYQHRLYYRDTVARMWVDYYLKLPDGTTLGIDGEQYRELTSQPHTTWQNLTIAHTTAPCHSDVHVQYVQGTNTVLDLRPLSGSASKL